MLIFREVSVLSYNTIWKSRPTSRFWGQEVPSSHRHYMIPLPDHMPFLHILPCQLGCSYSSYCPFCFLPMELGSACGWEWHLQELLMRPTPGSAGLHVPLGEWVVWCLASRWVGEEHASWRWGSEAKTVGLTTNIGLGSWPTSGYGPEVLRL